MKAKNQRNNHEVVLHDQLAEKFRFCNLNGGKYSVEFRFQNKFDEEMRGGRMNMSWTSSSKKLKKKFKLVVDFLEKLIAIVLKKVEGGK